MNEKNREKWRNCYHNATYRYSNNNYSFIHWQSVNFYSKLGNQIFTLKLFENFSKMFLVNISTIARETYVMYDHTKYRIVFNFMRASSKLCHFTWILMWVWMYCTRHEKRTHKPYATYKIRNVEAYKANCIHIDAHFASLTVYSLQCMRKKIYTTSRYCFNRLQLYDCTGRPLDFVKLLLLLLLRLPYPYLSMFLSLFFFSLPSHRFHAFKIQNFKLHSGARKSEEC